MLTNGKHTMANILRIALWNANGVRRHKKDIKVFLKLHLIDVMLISETHFTDKSRFNIPQYKCYHTNHPNNTGRAGSAVLVKDSVVHRELHGYSRAYLQATTVKVKAFPYDIAISAIYSPPSYNLKKENFEGFFCTLGYNFIAGGDYNSKHVMWGSRLTTTRGRELAKLVEEKNYTVISTETPTYWPTDPKRLPDLLDFFIIGGMSACYVESIPNFDLSSDHSPVIVTVNTTVFANRGSLLSRKLEKL